MGGLWIALLGAAFAWGHLLQRRSRLGPAPSEARESPANARSAVPRAWPPVRSDRRPTVGTLPSVVAEKTPTDISKPPETEGPKSAAEVAARLEQRFQADSRAPPLQKLHRTEAAFRDAVAAAAGVSLQNLECRSRTCRAEVRYSSHESDHEFTRTTFLDPSTMIEMKEVGLVIPVRTTEGDGSVLTAMYFVADGEPGPR